jgi:hypothetical protein
MAAGWFQPSPGSPGRLRLASVSRFSIEIDAADGTAHRETVQHLPE